MFRLALSRSSPVMRAIVAARVLPSRNATFGASIRSLTTNTHLYNSDPHTDDARSSSDDRNDYHDRSVMERLQAVEARLHDLERLQQPKFRAAQYNILASYLGSNTEPWFLFDGLTSSEDDRTRAEEIMRRHRMRDEHGRLVFPGWPSYAKGVLTDEEIERVERRDRESFSWEVRAPKILDAIRQLDADVLSLVELDHYDNFFRPELILMGMDSVWAKRPRASSHDGCAVCWRRSKFELVAHDVLDYCDDVEGTRRDRVALLTLLKMRYAPEETHLIFVSTHLARNPECKEQETVRLRQAAQLMTRLKAFADEHGCTSQVPAVVAGDWNAESLSEIRAVTSALFSLQDLSSTVHPLLLGSCDVPTRRTSFTLLRQSRIDYLMYSETFLRLQSVKRLETDDSMTIPNNRHPSDHLPISADFHFPTDLEIAQECARKFCISILRGSAVNRPLLPEELLAAFEYFDRDGSGTIDAEEVSEGLRGLGITETDNDVIRLQRACCKPTNKAGALGEATFETFRDAFETSFTNRRLAAVAPGGEYLDPFLADVVRAFRYFDLDGNGVLSRDEISTTLRAISPTAMDDATVDGILDVVDLNGDGNVQLDEFVSAMIKGHKGI